MKLFFGIDVSSEKLDVCVLDSKQNKLAQQSTANDLNGASEIKALVLKTSSSMNYQWHGIHLGLQFSPGNVLS
ncbi:IS110 family transposase [Sporolactobacillus inulinus]|nr:hypothetical protein [Sporolactobacillus inulinus]GEB78380.1 IS110 family transposase [Sporolactobacillus inulinus]